jgi:hypothetical protein
VTREEHKTTRENAENGLVHIAFTKEKLDVANQIEWLVNDSVALGPVSGIFFCEAISPNIYQEWGFAGALDRNRRESE